MRFMSDPAAQCLLAFMAVR